MQIELENILYFTKEKVEEFLKKQNIKHAKVESGSVAYLAQIFNISNYFIIKTDKETLAVDKLHIYKLNKEGDISSAKIDVRLSKAWRAFVYNYLKALTDELDAEGTDTADLAEQYKAMFERFKQIRIESAEAELENIKNDNF